MAVIAVEDVATAIGRPISDNDERDQVEQWISDVEMLISARLVGTGTGQVASLGALDQQLLAYVEREAVVARMRYKDDRNSQRTNGSTDDTDNGLEHYFLRILDPWWALLQPGISETTGAFSVRPTFDADTAMWPAANRAAIVCDSFYDWDAPL